MTNAELIKIAREKTAKMFAERTAKTGEEFEINVYKQNHNGAYINVKIKVPAKRYNYKWTEHWTVGSGCAVYAIAGSENITKKIRNAYSAHI